MIEADGPSTRSEFQECYPKSCARPTGGRYVRTTDDPAQRFSRAKSEGRAKGGEAWGVRTVVEPNQNPQHSG
jgi:hypothetical protein